MSTPEQPAKPIDATTVAADAAELAEDSAAVAAQPEEMKAVVLADNLMSAAERLAAVKLASDERRVRYELYRDIVLGLPLIIAALSGIIAVMQGREISDIKKTTKETHLLVNSGNLTQLRVIAVLTREKADRTQDPADIRAADEAEKAVREHVAKQKLADEASK